MVHSRSFGVVVLVAILGVGPAVADDSTNTAPVVKTETTGSSPPPTTASILSRLFGAYSCKGFSRNCLADDLTYGATTIPDKFPQGVNQFKGVNRGTSLGSNDVISFLAAMQQLPLTKDLVFSNALVLMGLLDPIADTFCPRMSPNSASRHEELFKCMKQTLYGVEDLFLAAEVDNATEEQFGFIFSRRPNTRQLTAVVSSFVVYNVDVDFIRARYVKMYPEAKVDPGTKILLFGVQPGSQEVGWIFVGTGTDGYGKPAVAIFRGVLSLAAYFTDREHRNRRIVNTKTGRW